MLDLDTLAEKYAATLNEGKKEWLDLLWSSAFQRVSQNMSDGEVEILLANCRSVNKLDAVLRYLHSLSPEDQASPYAVMIREAQNAGVGLSDWIASLPELAGLQS